MILWNTVLVTLAVVLGFTLGITVGVERGLMTKAQQSDPTLIDP